MPRLVTASHPSEADLLNLAAGREAPGLDACRKHLDSGCRLCDVRLKELTDLVEAVREEEAFDEVLESDDLPALPDFGGETVAFRKPVPQLEEIYRQASAAERLAEGIHAAARESDARLDESLRALYGNPSRGFALLYACQTGSAMVPKDPNRALELSRRVFDEAQSLMDANLDVRLATPAPREVVQAEAKLLESQAEVQLGNPLESRVAACEARALFSAGGDVGFGTALADYYEGQAAGFSKDYVAGERLLKKALRVFAEFGQENLMGRAEAALGTLYGQKGDAVRSLPYLEQAIAHLDPVTDIRPLTMVLHNRGQSLARLERFDEARSAYAKALLLARKLESAAHVQTVRISLAELELRRGSFERALAAFSELSTLAEAAGNHTDALFCSLCAAECLGRLGRSADLVEAIVDLRLRRKENPFAPSPAMEELFSCLDQGMVDADLVAHVRTFLQEEANGVQREYRPLRLAS